MIKFIIYEICSIRNLLLLLGRTASGMHSPRWNLRAMAPLQCCRVWKEGGHSKPERGIEFLVAKSDFLARISRRLGRVAVVVVVAVNPFRCRFFEVYLSNVGCRTADSGSVYHCPPIPRKEWLPKFPFAVPSGGSCDCEMNQTVATHRSFVETATVECTGLVIDWLHK